MKRALVVLAIVLLAAGFVRGWFALSGPHRAPESKKVDVNLTIDPEKMKEDAEEVKDKAEELGGKVKKELQDATRPADPRQEPAQPLPVPEESDVP
jgi:hypothetical protein